MNELEKRQADTFIGFVIMANGSAQRKDLRVSTRQDIKDALARSWSGLYTDGQRRYLNNLLDSPNAIINL